MSVNVASTLAVAPTGSVSPPAPRMARNTASESVVPTREPYRESGIRASVIRRIRLQLPITPLCMNSQVPHAKGWQFGRVIGVPVEARTWAK